jgi:hypothetical protein
MEPAEGMKMKDEEEGRLRSAARESARNTPCIAPSFH